VGIEGGGRTVSAWSGIPDAFALAEAMWNHAPQMEAARRATGISWLPLTGQDLSDLLVYLRSLPSQRGKTGRVADRRRQRWRSRLSLARLRKLPPVRAGATVATESAGGP
jgi:hypothetical protein